MSESLEKISHRAALFILEGIKDKHPAIMDCRNLFDRLVEGDAPSIEEWNTVERHLDRRLAQAQALALARARDLAQAQARAQDLDRDRWLDLALELARDLAQDRWLDLDLANHLIPFLGDSIPKHENLDKKILEMVQLDECRLKMIRWHICDTTHCLAGWAIHLSGEFGYEMEKHLGSALAGSIIYLYNTGSIPNFYVGDEVALEDLKQRAA